MSSSSSPMVPEIIASVEGLSSPFRDVSTTSLSSPYHVIDISPSPPPPALLNEMGQFDDAPSPPILQQPEIFSPITEAHTEQPSQTTQPNPASKLPSAPMIGLGLGIDTSVESLNSFAKSTAFIRASEFGNERIFSMIETQLSRPRRKTGSKSFPRSTRTRRAFPEDRGYLAEDEDEDHDHANTRHRSLELPRSRDNDTQDSVPRDRNYSRKIRDALARVDVVRQRNNSMTHRYAKVGPKGPKRLSFVENEPILARKNVASPLIDLWQAYHSHSPALRNVAGSPNKLVRRMIITRGSDSPTQSDSVLPIYISESIPNPANASIAPSSYTSALPCSATATMTISTASELPATALPVLSSAESPRLFPSSPRLEINSPMMGSAPGSFSPSTMDTSVFPQSVLNTPQPNESEMNSSTGTIVLSIMAGGLGICGIVLILFTIMLKRNGGWPSLCNWKRRPRGTAYDEFIEEEQRWWVRETKIAKPQSHQSFLVDEKLSKERASSCVPNAESQSISIARSNSGAPSIPPIANIVGGKMSIDSIRIELPNPSTPSDCLSISSESSGELSNPSHHDNKFINSGFGRGITDSESCSISHDLGHRMEAPAIQGRARSASKSSILSKASKKSMNSISSFFRLGIPIPTDPKFRLGAGVSSDDFGHADEDHQCASSSTTFASNKLDGTKDSDEPRTIRNISSPIMETRAMCTSDASLVLPRTKVYIHDELSTTRRVNESQPSITVSWTPPAILITDHPSELIPPSPPPPPPSGPRPVSVGTTFTRFSTASYLSEITIPDRSSLPDAFSDRIYSPPPARDVACSSVSRYASSIIDPEMIVSFKNSISPRISSLKSLDEELGNKLNNQYPKFHRSGPTRITSLSSLLSSRAQSGPLNHATNPYSRPHTTSRFCPPQRSSLSSIASSKTIRELAAVTEDLRALIDLDGEGEYSWHAPTKFHKSVPDRMPTIGRPPPPMRPPKSVNRYNRGKNMSIEFESTSTPSSPINPTMHFPTSSISSTTSYTSDWSLDLIQPPTKLYNRNVSNSRPVSIVDVNSSVSNVKTSNSGASLATALSLDSNTSIFEVASLHTAQAIRGASVEYVVRSPPQVSTSRRSGPMMAIVEEIED